MRYRPLRERFDEKWIPEPYSGCWLWSASCRKDGYGRILYGRDALLAHRVSYQLNVGEIPAGIFVCHRCDTPSCVNPSHLFLGTNSDNLADASRKGRMNGCPNNAFAAKLTPEDVINIRKSNLYQKEIAKEYGVSQPLVSAIKLRKVWSRI
jgi:hypothetical protein